MNTYENLLVEISKIPANSGHSLHKGTPREAFVKKFLKSHLPQTLAIGTGEIIDANSLPNPKTSRNQFDVVIYKKTYPKINFFGGIGGFLIESVIATIEVKSKLTCKELGTAITAAHNVKSLTPSIRESIGVGYVPPKILNYVVAYDGPKNMRTVHGWIRKIHADQGISIDNLPLASRERTKTPSPSIDGVYVLKRGFLFFDNTPLTIMEPKQRSEDTKWGIVDKENGSLLYLFFQLQDVASVMDGRLLDPVPYLASFEAEVKTGT